MGKSILIVAVALLLLIILIPFGIYFVSDARDRKFVPSLPGAQTPVKATVPLPLAQVRARLIKKWGAEFDGPNSYADLSHPEFGPQFKQFTVLPNERGNIDGGFRATDTGFSSDAPISTKGLNLQTEDPGLPAYLQLPIPERKHDLQLQSRGKWTASDMQKNGAMLPYESDYLIHLRSVKPNETEIMVLGFHASVVDGQRWSVIGDIFFTAPRRVDNVRYTPPSPADKRALLENLLKLL